VLHVALIFIFIPVSQDVYVLVMVLGTILGGM
jgi:hypothetical protein